MSEIKDTIEAETARPQENKNIRKSLLSTAKQSAREGALRASPLKQSRMDWIAEYYIARYPTLQFFYENDINGQVERWLSVDAELVPRESKSIREYEGFTSKQNSTYECVVGVGVIDGTSFDAYLMVTTPENYHQYKLAPVEQRNNEIRRSMLARGKAGGADSDADVNPRLDGGGSIQTYAPNLPTGGMGIEFPES